MAGRSIPAIIGGLPDSRKGSVMMAEKLSKLCLMRWCRLLAEEEKLWLYDVVEPGQAGEITVVRLTAANIAEYARVTQNPDSQYRKMPLSGTTPTRPWRCRPWSCPMRRCSGKT